MKKVILAIKKKYPFLEDAEIKEHNSFILFYEKHLLINTVITNDNITDCNNLISKIRQIFLDNSTGICLSTIHKAKGLECNRVFIIDREKTMPSKYAKLPWQKEQEFNLQYVAFTRAKNYLGFISDWSFF
jgi:superfamily I DNA/RNA helicase